MKSKKRKATINIEVILNENNLPDQISWFASDSKKNNEVAKAFILSFWDPNLKNSFNIDLWTKEMTMEEMKFFIFQNLLKMSGLIQKSTGDQELSKSIKNFATEFGEKSNVLKR
tara:strand:- start:84 stop:425 length:342 start_codon:yes stop_codon:yes gene_type:complete